MMPFVRRACFVRFQPAVWLVAVVLLATSAQARSATYYYVDRSSPSCSNSGPGTEARPFCSIGAAVNSRGGPGVTILVKAGVYPEQVTFATAGATDAPLVLQGAPGVVVDGADDFSSPAQWRQISRDVWLAPGVTWAPDQVFVDGARLASSAASPDSLPAHSFTWASGAGLYVNAGGGSPAGLGAQVGHRKYGFSLFGKSWVTIEGLTVTRTEDRGILLAGECTHVAIVADTVCFSNKMGIQITGGSDIRIASNFVHDNDDHGISLTAGANGCLLEDNESFRNFRPGERAANGIYLFGSPRNTLRRNRLHDNQDTGMHFQSGSDDCVAYLNRSWNNGDHGYDHLGARGILHVCDLAYGNYKDGFSIEGNAPGNRIFRSIAVENGLTTVEFDLWIDKASTPGFESNDNLFWNSTRMQPVKYIATLYPTVAAYSAVSGQDTRTLQADPRFVNPSAGDFRMREGSPAFAGPGGHGPGWSPTEPCGCSPADVEATLEAKLREARQPQQ